MTGVLDDIYSVPAVSVPNWLTRLRQNSVHLGRSKKLTRAAITFHIVIALRCAVGLSMPDVM